MKKQYLIFRNTKYEVNEHSIPFTFEFDKYGIQAKKYELKLVVKNSQLLLERLVVESENHLYPMIKGKSCIQDGSIAKTYILNTLYSYTGDVFIGREIKEDESMMKPWRRYEVLIHLKFSDGRLVYAHELIGEDEIYHYYEMVLLRKSEK